MDLVSQSRDCNDAQAWQRLADFLRPIALRACTGSDADARSDFPAWVVSWFYERRLSAIRRGTDGDPLSALQGILGRESSIEGQYSADQANETAARFLFAAMRDYALPDYYRERQRTRGRPEDQLARETFFAASALISGRLQERIDQQALVAQLKAKIAVLPVGRRVAFRLRFFPLLQTLDDSDILFIQARHSELPDEERLFDIGGELAVLRNDVYALLKAEAESTGRKDLSYELVGQLLACSANTANTNVLRACQVLRNSLEHLAEWRIS